MELPVVQMEYEIMELITNHDICIICSETGSGKSTQIPQFLYEAGYSSTVQQCQDYYNNKNKNTTTSTTTGRGGGRGGLIGITQPRRVAAISSAKRVAYEMGYGDGQSISSSNLVSYQTRYESVGYSDTKTEIQFMTDGILLQEIRNDLLLRKYSVIILDEAHERNLNTDILIGLLSIAIPLRNHHHHRVQQQQRRQQQQQDENSARSSITSITSTTTPPDLPDDDTTVVHDDLPPLKLIIMSATLRVEDFTKSSKLFPNPQYVPGVITIPGRTFPVTVHHNKVTELYNYGTYIYIHIYVCMD
jgi:ATP-dependent RNA helicase DHX37/DHR1